MRFIFQISSFMFIKRCHIKRPVVFIFFLFLLIIISNYIDHNFSETQKWRQHKNQSDRFISESSSTDFGLFHDYSHQCDVIHVAIVCAGSSASHQLVTLVKSVLFYRKTPLHVHFLVKKNSKFVLSYLFQTWSIPDFSVSFYSVDKHIEKISWIKNNHYSGVYGLLKVVILEILPDKINKVIVLDTDLIFNTDILNLWSLFKTFNDAEVIGLVENQSDWYFGTLWMNYIPWPALGRGFNTGVMLLDCKKMRMWNWNNKWQNITKNIIKRLHSTALADQDIFNSVLKEYPFLIHVLPCKWNIQLSDNIKVNRCSAWFTRDFGVFHLNKKKKKTFSHHGLKYPRLVYQMFANMNGDLLKLPAVKCGAIQKNVIEEKDLCKIIGKSGFLLRRVHLYFLPFSYDSDRKFDVSIVVHLTLERLSMFENVCMLWKGPISVALFASDAELLQINKFIVESKTLRTRTNIAYHVVYKNIEEAVYPINLLRNIALKNAFTDYVFLFDVDFKPMPNLYEYITSYISSLSFEKNAYIIPAFESLLFDLKIPKTKSELLDEISKGAVTIFKSRIWPRGHAATNYSLWYSATLPYTVKWSLDFEPYVVVKRQHCPDYDKRFSGFGWNKVSHIMELNASGYNFVVLPFGFIVHYPHVSSADLLNFRKSSVYRDCVRKLKTSFIDYLQIKYGKQNNFSSEISNPDNTK